MHYALEHISLSDLEMLVHKQFTDFALKLSLLHISFTDNLIVKEIKNQKLKNDWVDDFGYCRFMGDQFIKTGTYAVLKVPSAVIKEGHNFIINPLHSDLKKIKIAQTVSFTTDKKLFTI